MRERAAEEPTACLALFKELVELWIVHPPEPVLQRVVASIFEGALVEG